MTNSELLDLLREALGWMREVADRRGRCPDCEECDRRDAIIVKAEAALAEWQDSAKDVVESVEMKWEWHSVNSPNRVEAILTDGTRVTCRKANYNGVMGWAWDAEIRPVGFALTLDDAKSAAIAAARGVK